MLSISSIMALVFSRSNPERVSTETLMVLVLPGGHQLHIDLCEQEARYGKAGNGRSHHSFSGPQRRRSRASYLPSSACIITWEREVSFSLGRIFTKSSGTSVRAPSIETGRK